MSSGSVVDADGEVEVVVVGIVEDEVVDAWLDDVVGV